VGLVFSAFGSYYEVFYPREISAIEWLFPKLPELYDSYLVANEDGVPIPTKWRRLNSCERRDPLSKFVGRDGAAIFNQHLQDHKHSRRAEKTIYAFLALKSILEEPESTTGLFPQFLDLFAEYIDDYRRVLMPGFYTDTF
jgi:hypothetical protein